MHLALWVSFPKAVKLLTQLMGVQVSEATARRQTEAAGAAYEAVQNEQADQLVEEKEKKSKKGREKLVPAKPEGSQRARDQDDTRV